MEEIEKLRSGMNTKRIDFSMPKEHKFNITSYWLLGFIEGDGSFSYKSLSKEANFNVIQKGNKDLLIVIAEFLQSYSQINSIVEERPELELLKNTLAEDSSRD